VFGALSAYKMEVDMGCMKGFRYNGIIGGQGLQSAVFELMPMEGR
jgi:hypothetical protein